MGANALPVWVQYLQALSTPAIAIAGLAIAFGQLSLAHYRLRHDLYDRRYKVFDGARKFLVETLRDGTCQYEQIFEFVRNTGDAVFLFDPAVIDYLEEFRKRAFEIRKAEAVMEMPADPNREKAIKAKYDQRSWFEKVVRSTCREVQTFLEIGERSLPFANVSSSLSSHRWICAKAAPINRAQSRR